MRAISEIEIKIKGLNIKDKAAFIVQEYTAARVAELEYIEHIKLCQELEKSVTADNSLGEDMEKARNITLHVENGRVIISARYNHEHSFVRDVQRAARTARGLEAMAKQLNIELPAFKNVGEPKNPVFIKV